MSEADALVNELRQRVEALEKRIAALEKIVNDDAAVTLRWSEMLAKLTRNRIRESRHKNDGKET
jgi:chaperonin cofactor prefoldin